MAWLIVSEDAVNGAAIRADDRVMEAHWQYECANRSVILLAGSLRQDDRETKTGSVLLLDLETREEAERFFMNDPATRAGLRGATEIRWLNPVILDRIVQD